MISLPEERLRPDIVKRVRARLMHRPLRPMTLFCGPLSMAALLEGTGISMEEVKKHSNQIVPGLWRFYIADYDNPTAAETPRRSQRLVHIATNPQALRDSWAGKRSDNRGPAAGTSERTDDKG